MKKIDRGVAWYAIEGQKLRLMIGHIEGFHVDNREDLLDKEEIIRRLQRMMYRNEVKVL